MYDFDQAYANYIMQNDEIFIQFMQVIRDLYQGKNVILLVYREEQVLDGLTESLCKFIQQRYGYNYQILNDISDLNIYDKSNFSVQGIALFDVDNARYLQLLAKFNPKIFMDEDIAAKNGYVV